MAVTSSAGGQLARAHLQPARHLLHQGAHKVHVLRLGQRDLVVRDGLVNGLQAPGGARARQLYILR